MTRREFIRKICASSVVVITAGLGRTSRLAAADKPVEEMVSYVCTVCGYIYDPNVGEPRTNTPAGTPFSQLPDYWVCPDCGADTSAFVVW
ncbi:MAG: rubredoxin [Desulfomonilia bacterium]